VVRLLLKILMPVIFRLNLKAFFMAPLNGDYYFHIECDAAFSLAINDKVMVDHFMSDFYKGYKDFKWGEETVSEKISLNSGMLY